MLLCEARRLGYAVAEVRLAPEDHAGDPKLAAVVGTVAKWHENYDIVLRPVLYTFGNKTTGGEKGRADWRADGGALRASGRCQRSPELCCDNGARAPAPARAQAGPSLCSWRWRGTTTGRCPRTGSASTGTFSS